MQIHPSPSPNFDSRNGTPISMLVLHYTGMPDVDAARERMCNESAKVSAHYLVEEDGKIWQLVEEEQRAWHAGISFWRGLQNVNANSIGIEIQNPGHEWGYRAFPDAQMDAVKALCLEILKRHPLITPVNVVAHADIAPARKDDPGELFPWADFAANGIGVFPQFTALDISTTAAQREEWNLPPTIQIGDEHNGVKLLQRDLARYGYMIQEDGVFDAVTMRVVTAFQRHFRPALVNGEWDNECETALQWLLKNYS